MDFTEKEINYNFFIKDTINKENKTNRKKVINKLKIAFFLLLILSVSTYIFLLNGQGRFYSSRARFIFAGVLSLTFIINYVVLNAHLYFDVNLKHYTRFYQIYDVAQFLLLVIFIIMFTQMFLFKTASISGPSMEPTLKNNDQVIVKQVNRNFKRDDVVVIDATNYSNNYSSSAYKLSETNDEFYIKRIKAIPKDKIALKQVELTNKYEILINNEPLKNIFNESVIVTVGSIYYDNLTKMIFDYSGVIPEDMYLLIGDNTNNSRDSRSFGLVVKDDILGVVNFRIWKNMGWIK